MPLLNTGKIIKGAKLITSNLSGYKLRIFWIIVLGLLSGLFSGIGVSVVIPLFSVLTDQKETAPNFIIKAINETLSFLGIPLNAFSLILVIVALFFLKAFVQFLGRYLNEKAAAIFEEETRNKLFKKTIKTSWANLLKSKGGYLERVLMYDVARGGAVINSVGSISLLLSGFIVYAFIALGISALITLSTISFGIIIFFVLKPVLYKVRKLIREMADNEKITNHHINESITGAKTIKSYAAENSIIGKSKIYFEKLKTARIRVSFIRNALGQFGEPAGIIFIGLVFLLTYKNPGFSIASFAVAVYLIQKMFNTIQNAQSQLNNLNELVPYLKVIRDYYENAVKRQETSEGSKKFKFGKKLEFKNVYFSYAGNSNNILAGVSFSIKKNSKVGIIGPSGVGKTTIADLMMRLLKPQKGEIIIDGKNAERFSIPDWRKNIAYVSQDVFLINDTIENNIRFFDDSIREENIIKAAKEANIYNGIMKMENGFKSAVGERGVELSAGQRQRISLARALVRNPQILILDEATSSLDNESEKYIQKAIKNLGGRITIITIAHRLSTIMDSDSLLVLDNGRIIEEGKPSELLKNKDSHFYRMYNIR